MTKLFFQSHGCSSNLAEAEMMMGMLAKASFSIEKSAEVADIVVLNLCTVKGEVSALREIRRALSSYKDKKFIITGCLTKELVIEIRKLTSDASLVSTHNITKIVEVVEELLQGNVLEAITFEDTEKINLPRVRKNPIIGVVPILSGCSNDCTYCSVRLIKGKLKSYKKEDIIKEVNHCLGDGCKEIWITSQDNASYGTERIWRSELPELLWEILAIERDFILRIGMMNINNLRPIIDEMIEIFNHEKVFKFLHVPLQSADNLTLERMKRNYTYEEFKTIVNKFKTGVKNLTLSTDLICGFPRESEEAFFRSNDSIRELAPDVLNISRFIARKGTPAASYDQQVKDGESKRRSRILTDSFRRIALLKNEQWIDWTGEVLIDEIGKEGSFIGRNSSYKQIILHGNFKLGDRVKVRIKKVTPFDLRAEVL